MTAPPLIQNFKPFSKNTLRGFFDVELSSGMILSGCCLHEKNGHFWTGLPGRQYTKDDGTQWWSKVVDFRDKQTHRKFQNLVTPLAVAAFERAKGEAAA